MENIAPLTVGFVIGIAVGIYIAAKFIERQRRKQFKKEYGISDIHR